MQQGKIDFASLLRRVLEEAYRDFQATPAAGKEASEELLRLSSSERREWLETAPIAQDPRLVQYLSEESLTTGGEDPARSLALAELAVQAAEAWGRRNSFPGLARDLEAEAWMYLANARRLAEDYDGAELAWKRVASALPRGTGQPLLAAEVPEFQAALRRDQRRLQESEVLLREAITRYEQVLHDSHLAGRARISLGTTYLVAGRPAESLRESCEAAIHLDPRREPRFVVGIFHNLSLCLSDLGRKRAAVCLLQTARPLYDLLAGPLFRLRATWLEGRLYLGLKDWLSAAACFEAARRAFIERALRYDAALVALELALVYAENRDFRRVALLAAEMYPVFLSQEIPREASASLLLFADAARERRVTARSIAATIAEISALRHRRPRPDGASAPPP